MKRSVMFCWLAICALLLWGRDFREVFCDSTLRLDYIFSASDGQVNLSLSCQTKTSGWAGRRHGLNELPRLGNGVITVIEASSGDTIYRNSFSSLFSEWLRDPESTTSLSFENSFLVPLPRTKSKVEIQILDAYHRSIGKMSHVYDPADVLIVDRTSAKPQNHRYIHRSSDASSAIDVAIVAEGYREQEMDSFYRHAEVAVEAILSHEPFTEMADRFNFVAVATPSVDSGVSVPRLSEWKNTACKSHFSTFYSDRYLTTNSLHTVHELLNGIPYEHIIILANTDEYGGGGIYNSYTLTTARHPMFRPVVVHEFGHSFGGLADEYFYENDVMTDTYPLDVEPWEPNITTLVDFGSKWERQIPEGTPRPTPVDMAEAYPVGLYEGGGYSFKRIYRPADVCRMRNNKVKGFCQACQESLRSLIRFYTE